MVLGCSLKKDEPFNTSIKSTGPPVGLIFKLAEAQDREGVTALMAERNPGKALSEVLSTTDRETALNASDPNSRLFIAVLNGRVVGLCRYFDSQGLPKEKLRYLAPHGWYCMGLIVDKSMRRQGIARFLFQERLKSLKERGTSVIYSFVDSENLSSVKMHQEFGFEEIERGPGFLHVKFAGLGILYRMAI